MSARRFGALFLGVLTSACVLVAGLAANCPPGTTEGYLTPWTVCLGTNTTCEASCAGIGGSCPEYATTFAKYDEAPRQCVAQVGTNKYCEQQDDKFCHRLDLCTKGDPRVF